MDGEPEQTRPSRESLREVKREAKERQRARSDLQRRAGRALPDPTAAPRGSRRWRPVLLAVPLLLAGGGLWAGHGWLPGSHAGTATPPLYPVTHASATPSDQPTPTARSTPAVDAAHQPFAGSPVQAWHDGAQALVPPAPARIGPYGPKQVADAYAKSVRWAEAANLDPVVLWHGSLAPVYAAMDGQDVGWLRALAGKEDVTSFVTRFHPADVRPRSSVVKTNGRMNARLDKKGQLVVTLDYAFVYAVTTAQEPSRLVLVRRHQELQFDERDATHVGLPWIGDAHILADGGVCGLANPYPAYFPVQPDNLKPGLGVATPAPGINPLDLTKDPARAGSYCWTDESGLNS